ncbi:MAG: putative murein peptide carboxypeptidase [Chlamydiia bacterium]|nr:putative murein peptide carboxypeptidase [Chlamydiia bacterium]MCH9615663.1 putative murein peptide carboxypeptidase [Chlamydiia bacterium]MCH9628934.1 putative murein peptide carboxypeptidase [Chlamydiia bacterium]
MIGVVLPSSPLPKEKIKALVKTDYVLPSNLELSCEFLAGSDLDRANAFMDVWMNPDVSVVWGARGGYGAMRILPFLDFDALLKNPKPFIGMSDITALHITLNNLGMSTYLGANICTVIGTESDEMGYTLYPIVPGTLKGKAVGGNLSLIAALVGTPWQLETAGKILILEDVNEPPYKVDRLLTQLKLAGLLDHLAGVILGDLDADEFFKDAPYPVYGGFPTGHIDDQMTIPLETELYLREDNVLVDPTGLPL